MVEVRPVDITGPILRALDSVEIQVSEVGGRVSAMGVDLADARSTLEVLKAAFYDYVKTAERTANIQQAETRLGTLKADLDRKYGHYRVVRRTSVGILQAFDVGNVTKATVAHVTEELMIQTPGYWLAPAIVALAAWSKDDEHIAELSIQEAFNRDPRKTSLFFALVLRRSGRTDIGSRWLRHYLQGLDPEHLGREFAVIYEAAAQGAFGAEGTKIISERVAQWHDILRQNPELMEKQAETWKRYVGTHGESLGVAEFPLLRRYSPDFKTLCRLLEKADALGGCVEEFESALDQDSWTSVVVEDRLDEILELLVTEFDAEELPLREKVAYNEAVIEENGDLERAEDSAEVARAGLQPTTDILSLQTVIAMRPDLLGVGVKTRQLAIGTSRDEIMSGIADYTLEYRSDLTPNMAITFGPDHTKLATVFEFGTWTTRTDVPESQGISSLRDHWSKAFRDYLENAKMRKNDLSIWGVVVGVLTLLLLVGKLFLVGAIVGIAGASIIGYQWHKRQEAENLATKRLESLRSQAIEESTLLYRGCLAEYYDAGMLYAELDGREEELMSLVRGWPVGVGAVQESQGAVFQ